MRIRCTAVLLSITLGAKVGAQQDSSRVRNWAEIFTRARQAQSAHDDQLAKTLYDSVIALDPRNSMAYMQRGMVNHNLADTAAARADFQKSLALGNTQAADFLSGPNNLANTPADTVDPMKRAAMLNESGVSRLAQGDTVGALTDLKRAYELGNTAAGDLFVLVDSRMAGEAEFRRQNPWYVRLYWAMPIGLLFVPLLAIALTIRMLITPSGLPPMDELEPGEKLLWSGVPRQSLSPNATDVLGLIKGLFFLAAATFVFHTNVRDFMYDRSLFVLLGAGIAAVGAWQVVGPYFNTLRDRKRSAYLVTDKRVLIARSSSYFIEHKLSDLSGLKVVNHRDGTSTIESYRAPALLDHVPDGARVKALIDDARETVIDRLRKGQTQRP